MKRNIQNADPGKHEGAVALSQKCKTRHPSSRRHGADLTITKERPAEREIPDQLQAPGS